MPLHRIFHPPSAFSSSEKATLSERITAFYTEVGLPAFYVVVLFIPIESDSFFVGGKSTDKFIRIIVQHLARQMPNEERKKQFSERYENTIAPFIKEKGYDWEVRHIICLLFLFIILLFSRYMSKKYLQICGERMDLFRLLKILKLKKNGHVLINHFHIDLRFYLSSFFVIHSY